MSELSLSSGRGVTLVDDSDVWIAAGHKWRRVRGPRTSYAATTVRQDGAVRFLYLHRMVMAAALGVEVGSLGMVDHINRDGLDNRRVNLRLATASENAGNTTKRHGSSRFKGVGWDKKKGKWRVQIRCLGRNVFVGYFGDEVEAALAYDAAAISQWGEFALTNAKGGLLPDLARTSRPLAPWTAGDLRRAAQAGARARKNADDVWRDVP